MVINKNAKLPESQNGTEVYNTDLLVIKWHYDVDYIHSYAQDSEFFRALGKKQLLGSECTKCGYKYATPRGHCMMCGNETKWIELPLSGKIHSWTTCYFSGEEFLNETPFNLVMVEFDGIDSLFMSRLIEAEKDDIYIGMPVKAKFRKWLKYNTTDVYFVPDV